MDGIKYFFRHTYAVQNSIVKTATLIEQNSIVNTYKKCVQNCLTTALIVCFIFSTAANENVRKVLFYAMFVFLILNCLIYMMANLVKVFTSITTFLSVGLLCEIGITALIISVLGIINVQSLINQPILEDVILPVKDLIILFIPFLICMFVFGLVWNYFCVIANTSVGITVNTIIAGALGIIMLVANTIFLLLPQGYNFGFSDEVIKQFTDLGYTVLQMYQIMINMITVPLLIINGVSIVICQLKSYWVEKYNDGKQITYIE